MRKMRVLSSVLASVLLIGCIGVSGCKKEEPTTIEYDRSAFFGLAETPAELAPNTDGSVSSAWVLDTVKALGAQAFRVEVRFSDLFKVKKDDGLSFHEETLEKYREFIDGLTANGVKKISLVNTAYLHPYGYGVTSEYAVPDPVTENADYVRFLQLQEKGFTMLAREFPEVEYFEPSCSANEDKYIHKNGCVDGGEEEKNAVYAFSADELHHIVADMCWYVNRGVSRQNGKARVVLPAIADEGNTDDFLTGIYRAISSQSLPIAEEFSDNDPDHYFQVLYWQPEITQTTDLDKALMDGQKELYAIAQSYGDGDKPVWYAQIGWQDETTTELSKDYLALFDKVKEELPFVETVYLTRLISE